MVDKLVTTAGVLDCFLPLQIKLVALLVQAFELLCCFVKLDLSSLGFGNLLFKLLALRADFNSQLFDLQSQLLDLCFIGAPVFFKRKVIFFFLSGGKSPLLEFFLVPVHFKFELIHALVSLEDHVLNVVQTVLLVGDSLLKLLNLVFQAARLSLCDLLHVLFGLDLFVLGVDK